MTNLFNELCSDLISLIDKWEIKLGNLPSGTITDNRNSQNRTIKQITGHMIDSATNNTHRIIHMHYQESPAQYPDYANLGNNDRWIAIQNYQDEEWDLMIRLWTAVNLHLVHLIRQIDETRLNEYWISAVGDMVTLEEMIRDYPSHFRLHLAEIDELINIHP